MVPQLPEMDLRRSRAVYAAKPCCAEVHRGILNANAQERSIDKDSLTMQVGATRVDW